MGKGDDVQEDGTHGYDDDARGDTLRQRRTGHPRESASITRRKKMLRLEHDTYESTAIISYLKRYENRPRNDSRMTRVPNRRA